MNFIGRAVSTVVLWWTYPLRAPVASVEKYRARKKRVTFDLARNEVYHRRTFPMRRHCRSPVSVNFPSLAEHILAAKNGVAARPICWDAPQRHFHWAGQSSEQMSSKLRCKGGAETAVPMTPEVSYYPSRSSYSTKSTTRTKENEIRLGMECVESKDQDE